MSHVARPRWLDGTVASVPRMSRSWYIALEGPEGCGKSTQAAALASALDAVLTRETGGTAIGLRIREILHDVETTGLAARSEALLTAADRAQHLAEVVEPALADGRHVVSDRSVYSALAYQGYGRELDVDEVRRINDWAVGSRWPDLVVLLDAGPDVLAARLAGRELDRFEREDEAFHRRVADGFRTMAAADPDHWVTIDAGGQVDEVTEAVLAAVHDRLPT
jgi:dTMP kinase